MKILHLVLPVVAAAQLFFFYCLNSAYNDSIIEGSLLPILEDKKDAPQNEWSTRSNNARPKANQSAPRVQPKETDEAPRVNPTERNVRTTKAKAIHANGTIVSKRFNDGNYYEGEIIGYDNINKYYLIKYLDGQQEDLDENEMKRYYKQRQKYSKKQYNTRALNKPYRLQLEKHRLRHAYNAYTNYTSGEAEQRIVLFVHFHKAGGTSMFHKFRDSGYQSWNRQANGIPLGLQPPRKGAKNHTESDQLCRHIQTFGNPEIMQFWRYSRPQFEAFLRDGRSQQLWPYCLPEPERIEDPQREARNGVELFSLEWNFLISDHFFNKDYLRNQAKIDFITILRDPYDRFLSNFYFHYDNPGDNYDDPMEWAHLDLIRKRGSAYSFVKPNKRTVHLPHYQYGEITPQSFYFSVNYNKPNYYTAFLNGLAENTDDAGDNSVRFDFEYYAFELNRTHLDIAKQRLESIFDAVLILERPETHGQLDRWFAFLGESANNYYPHRNKRDVTKGPGTEQYLHPLNFTREEFYRYNALDKELYDFALELSLSKK